MGILRIFLKSETSIQMKKLLPVITLLLLTLANFSCKKTIEKKQEDLVVDAITNGVWIVQQYFEAANNISSQFADYDFQFFKNGSVTGTKSGNITNGTWSGNASNYSITSNFPTATDPVQKLNGVWKITDSYWDYVKAEMTTPAGKNILHLKKKP
jgi:hypothetical protein